MAGFNPATYPARVRARNTAVMILTGIFQSTTTAERHVQISLPLFGIAQYLDHCFHAATPPPSPWKSGMRELARARVVGRAKPGAAARWPDSDGSGLRLLLTRLPAPRSTLLNRSGYQPIVGSQSVVVIEPLGLSRLWWQHYLDLLFFFRPAADVARLCNFTPNASPSMNSTPAASNALMMTSIVAR